MKNIREKNYPFEDLGFLIGGLGGFNLFLITNGFDGRGGGALGEDLGFGLFCMILLSFMLNSYQKIRIKAMNFQAS